ncbi:DUF3592 domain-containing protein [Chromobacterium alticapitis]|uniref:DUF3592 domain-containing protein n=1 Tax=Chromobacterium alticapitis TaxID=2073169 RepID=A0A2S5DI33_9NEIS|nr:DUF3592 domain-containing protein [Chromobacterium alticapitis]POZ62662.1 DUF3592 domain-containing protein [Chromobacterium alticapitis]
MPAKLPALLLIAIGVAGFCWLWRQAQLANAAQDWPSTMGTVERSQVEWRLRRGGDHNEQREYRADVRYQYKVSGQTYRSGAIRIPDAGFSSSEALARDTAGRYPVGAAVPVRYNPAKPEQACLEAGAHWSVRAGQLLMLLFAAAGAWLLTR